MSERKFASTLIRDSEDKLGLTPEGVNKLLADTNTTVAKTKGFTKIGDVNFEDGLIFTSLIKLLDAGNEDDEMAGVSGIAGDDKEDPAFWAGGTYEQAIGGTAKAIIRHDGTSKFTEAEIEGKVTAGSVGSARTEINDAGVQIFNALNKMNIRFGIKDGYAVMEYYDNDGNLLYDLGPNGLGKLLVRTEGWTEIKKVKLTSEFSTSLDPMQLPVGESYKDMSNATIITCYRYTSAISEGVITDLMNDGRIFNAPEISSGRIPNSIYCDYDSRSGGFFYPTKGTNSRLFGGDLPKFHMENEPVYDRPILFYRPLQKYASGVVVGEINAYWNHP